MTAKVVTVSPELTARQVRASYFDKSHRKHQGYPVIDRSGALVGMITPSELPGTAGLGVDRQPHHRGNHAPRSGRGLRAGILPYRRRAHGAVDVGRLPVVSIAAPSRLLGIVTRSDLLKPRERHVRDEQERERLIRFKFFNRSAKGCAGASGRSGRSAVVKKS